MNAPDEKEPIQWLISPFLSFPLQGAARLLLGTWQGIYLWEHREAPQRRHVAVTLIGA